MHRVERRRLQREKDFKNKTTTRQDVVEMLDMYHEHHVKPLIEHAMYRSAPFYLRLWWLLKGWWRMKRIQRQQNQAPTGNAGVQAGGPPSPSVPPVGAEAN